MNMGAVELWDKQLQIPFQRLFIHMRACSLSPLFLFFRLLPIHIESSNFLKIASIRALLDVKSQSPFFSPGIDASFDAVMLARYIGPAQKHEGISYEMR